jgi:hypothetical protein
VTMLINPIMLKRPRLVPMINLALRVWARAQLKHLSGGFNKRSMEELQKKIQTL